MQTDTGRIFLNSIGLFFAAGLQIWAGRWRIFFEERIAVGESGAGSTLWFSIVDTLLGVATGILLSVILFPKKDPDSGSKTSGAVVVISFLIAVVAIGIKLSAALGITLHLPLSLGLEILVWDWVVKSGVPSVWLGLTSVALVYRLKSRTR